MTLAELIPLAISVSIFLVVFTLGLGASWRDAYFLYRRSGLIARSILAMNVVMLALAIALVFAFDPPLPIKIALVALAVSPVPPVLPIKQRKAGGTGIYAVNLLAAAAVISLVLIPVALVVIEAIFGRQLRMPEGKVGWVLFRTILMPLAFGILVRQFAPRFAQKIARPTVIIAVMLLIIAVLPALVAMWPAVSALIGSGMIVLLVAFSAVGIVVGHALGGPDPDDRIVLALATSARHPAVALAITGINFPNEKAIVAVVVCHLIVAAIVALPYMAWQKRAHAAPAAPTAN
jgi:BASS family bile acid:Na+ symporter